VTLEEFSRNAEAWGGDIARWPQVSREGAARIAATPQGAAILARARAVDLLIADAEPAVAQARVDDAIHAVVLRLAGDMPRRRRFADLLPRWLVPATGLAVAVALGALIGVFDPLLAEQPDDVGTTLTMIFDATSTAQEWFIQ
jgi:hypothetical protein